MAIQPCTTDTETVHLSQDAGGALQADVTISGNYGNVLEVLADGLYARGPQAAGSIPAPGIAEDGDTLFYSPRAGVMWMFRYNADNGLPNQWEFVGGAPLMVAIEGATAYITDATPSGSWGNGNGSSGPDLIVPLSGVYTVRYGARVDNTNVGGGGDAAAFGIAQGTTASPIAAAQAYQNNIGAADIERSVEMTLAQGTTLRMRYLNTFQSNTATFRNRRYSITPVRV